MEKCGTAGQATDGDNIRFRRMASWITKAKNTHSDYLILMAFSMAIMVRFFFMEAIPMCRYELLKREENIR